MTDLSVILGLSIRYYREKLNLTQKELSDRSGFQRAYISDLEQGKINTTVSTIEEISKALEIHPSKLLVDPGSDDTKIQISPREAIDVLYHFVKAKSESVSEIPSDIMDSMKDADETQLNMVRGALGIKQQQKAKKKKEEAV